MAALTILNDGAYSGKSTTSTGLTAGVSSVTTPVINKENATSSVSTSSDENTDYSDSVIADDTMIKIFGAPYQFMENVDRRIEDENTKYSYGRKYAEKILSRMPILFISPGNPSLLSEFNKSNKKTILEQFASDNNKSAVESIIDQSGRFYTFDFDYANYFNYVNPACRVLAKLLGIEDETITMANGKNVRLKNVDWGSAYASDKTKKLFSSAESIAFYLDGEKQISESFSNSTTTSSLVDQVNSSISEQAKEYVYLSGAALDSSTGSEITSGIKSILSSIGNLGKDDSGFLNTMTTATNSLLSGGKVTFPKMWSSSETSNDSYSLNVKLRSPDHDTLSIYLNILVPYIHIWCMTIPHVYIDSDNSHNQNSFVAPFMVRCFYKGFFNVDMGIIRDLTVTKGAECQWNSDGLPTQIDLSIGIEDLYSNIFATPVDDIFASPANFLANTGELDFLANMAALNIMDPEITRKVELYKILVVSNIKNLPNNVWRRISNKISNVVYNLYKKISF